MYKFYLNGNVLPVTPGSMKTTINNQNKTITLINDGEVNILKEAGLGEFTFKFMLPKTNYPFCNFNYASLIESIMPSIKSTISLSNVSGLFTSQEEWLRRLSDLKQSKKPFWFKVMRVKPGLSIKNLSYNSSNGSLSLQTFSTNVKVSIEEYSISEDADEMMDVWIDIKLKIWRPYSTHEYKKTTNAEGKEEYSYQDTREEDTSIDGISGGGTSLKDKLKEMMGI